MRQKIELYNHVEDAKEEADRLTKFGWFVHTMGDCLIKGGDFGLRAGKQRSKPRGFDITDTGDKDVVFVVYRNMGDGKELPIAKSKATDSKSTDDSTVPDDWFDDE